LIKKTFQEEKKFKYFFIYFFIIILSTTGCLGLTLAHYNNSSASHKLQVYDKCNMGRKVSTFLQVLNICGKATNIKYKL